MGWKLPVEHRVSAGRVDVAPPWAPKERSIMRRLAQWYLDDPHMMLAPGPNPHLHTHFEGYSKDVTSDLIFNEHQSRVQLGDTTYLLDTMATMNLNTANFDGMKDALATQVQAATGQAAEDGNAEQANLVAQGASYYWSTAALPHNNNMRSEMGMQETQGAIQAALESEDPRIDIPAAATTGQEHAEASAHPSLLLNWRR